MAFALDFVRGMDEDGLKHLIEQGEVGMSHQDFLNCMIKPSLTGFWFEEGIGRIGLCLWKEGSIFFFYKLISSV